MLDNITTATKTLENTIRQNMSAPEYGTLRTDTAIEQAPTIEEEVLQDVKDIKKELHIHRMETNNKRKNSKGDSGMSKTVVLGGGGMGACGFNPAMYGGGYGWGGFPPVGLFGLNNMWGNHHGGMGGWNRGEGLIPMEAATQREIGNLNTTMNSRFDDVNGDVRTSRIESRVGEGFGSVNGHLGNMGDKFFTKAMADQKTGFDIEKTILMGNNALTTAIKDCCCCTEKTIMSEACKTRETICCDGDKTRMEIRRQTELIERIERERDKVAIVDLKNENSNLRQTEDLKQTMYAIMARMERLEHGGGGRG